MADGATTANADTSAELPQRERKEFHTKEDLSQLKCKDIFLGCGPLLCLLAIFVFAVIVMSIPHEKTPNPTLSPTMPPSPAPSASPTISAFNERREAFITANLASDVVLQAYSSMDLTASLLNSALAAAAPTKANADFGWIDLVRVLYLIPETATDTIQDIYNVANVSHFWITSGETKQYYWTENHLFMWDSTAHLLKQHDTFADLQYDNRVDERLKTALDLKKNNGFFERESNTYFPYTLSALLNLADFSQNDEIQNAAMDAVELLLSQVLEGTNSEGALFVAEARSTNAKYLEDWSNANGIKCIGLLTGLGPEVSTVSAGNVFIATTSMDLSTVIASYTDSIENKITSSGLSIADFSELNDNFDVFDTTVFQMSAGLFWSPEVVQDTLDFVANYSLESHPEFAAYVALFTDPSAFGFTHTQLIPLSSGSELNNITSVLYKNGPAILSSFDAYLYQYLAYQQYPSVASTGTIAVFANSGDGSVAGLSNIHLPFVKQNNNVALLKYDSSVMSAYAALLASFGVTDIVNVYWYFPENRFDEVRNYSNWILGKEVSSTDGQQGYVALRRDDACVNEVVDDIITCDQVTQVYALFVGSSNDYDDFDAFETLVEESTFDASTNTLTIDSKSVSVGGWL